MLRKSDLFRAAAAEVNSRRQAARLAADANRERALSGIPGFSACEAAYTAAGARLAFAAVQGEQAKQTAKANFAAAAKKREEMLRSAGMTVSMLEPVYVCPYCNDTGSYQGKTCSCVLQLMRKMRREEIAQTTSLSLQSFSTLKTSYYPKTRDAATGVNINLHMTEVLEDLQAYAANFDLDSVSLLLLGNAGLGKTHAALAIANEVLNKGFDVIYISSAEFFSKMDSAHFSGLHEGEDDLLLEAVEQTDLLILDDLGTELISPYVLSVFYNLMNSRFSSGKPTIFTSNITDSAVFEKRYTEKIMSRLAGNCEPFLFLGEDIRQMKAMEADG